ncbi:type IV pilus biogenesis/stability protein PilW [Colwellia hornerae]|nr:type IV pilus biogenesis/stability protein PilW [Colwellia hornerae]
MPWLFITSVIALLTVLSGCVTQNYENDSTIPVVESDSSNNEMAMTRISLGLGYLKMGNTSQAKLNLEKAKRFSPNLSQVYTAFAHYYDVVGESQLATNAYEQALSIDAKNPDTLNNYGVFLCRHEKYADAEKYTLKAIAIPTYLMVSQSYENLALCQLKAGEFVKAEKYFTKSIQHSPNRASALLQMVRLQYVIADYKTAQRYLKRYEKATRRFSPEALSLAYKVFKKQRNHRIAKNYASMLLKMFPNSYQAKQYILNALAHTEADDLARVYQASIMPTIDTSPQKRVVVLSPNKAQKKRPKPESKKVKNTESSSVEKITVKHTQSQEKVVLEAKIHIVVKGDSLFSLSKQYNTHMKTLERWNNITRSDILKLGQKLHVSLPTHTDVIPTNNATNNAEQEKTQ